MADGDKDYALIVGIDKYPSALSLKPLEGAVGDARDFKRWLIKAGVPKKHIKAMVSDKKGIAPRLHEIVAAVERIYNLSDNSEEPIGRRLYIFLAGHGVGPDLDEVGLLAADTSNVTKYFPGRLYANLFRGRALFEQVVLCMDCCRDEDADLPDPYFPFDRRKTAGKLVNKVKQFYVFATGFARKSREREFEGRVRGVFTRALLAGLEQGAVDGDGKLTGASLKRYLAREIPKLRGSDSDQDPDLRGIDDDFIFAEGLPPRCVVVTVHLSDTTKRLVVLYGKGLQPVNAEALAVDATRVRVEVPAGKTYLFRLLHADGTTFKEVGETIDDDGGSNVIEL